MAPDRWLRPESAVLPDSSLIPPENLIRPPPNRFTHELVVAESFYFGTKADSEAPDGELEAKTKLVLLHSDDKTRCRVVDGRGLHVEVSWPT